MKIQRPKRIECSRCAVAKADIEDRTTDRQDDRGLQSQLDICPPLMLKDMTLRFGNRSVSLGVLPEGSD